MDCLSCSTRRLNFYCFPSDQVCRQQWIDAVRRINSDGSPWQPSAGDRVCSIHFTNGQKSDDPTHPAYIPSHRMSGATELQRKVSDGALLRAYLTHLYCVPIFIGASRGSKNEEEQIRRYEHREACKRLQLEVDRQQQALESFQEYFNMEHDYAAKDSRDSLSPSPKKNCDCASLRLKNEKCSWRCK